MNAKTTHLTRPTLAPLRRALLCSTAIDAVAIGAGMIDLAKAPVFISNLSGETAKAA
ncbi:hypothetical protein [Pleomorphomonas koreensis]|uniref:hypothetical protein n=1 Tax=Pleomorphomonas koreensis TaxID=257440 RepID=UPI00041C50D1|nr:hypothetical protein [Pleomorphomonas koreensis]